MQSRRLPRSAPSGATVLSTPADGRGVYLVHERGGSTRPLATDVEVAEGLLDQALGLMFRPYVPADYALAFPFERVRTRGFHTAFVRVPIDVVWVADGEVTRVETMRAWADLARGRADLVCELAAGEADGVEPGDRLRLVADEAV